MLNSWKSLSLLAVLVAAGFMMALGMLFKSGKVKSGFISSARIDNMPEDTAFGGLFYHPHIDDSLPYYLYKPIADSIERIKSDLKWNNESTKLSGFSLGNIGLVAISDKQNPGTPSSKLVETYYLALASFDTENYETKFFMDKGTFNLAYLAEDSVIKRAPYKQIIGHYERKQIGSRYSAEKHRVYIPMTAKQYGIWKKIALTAIVFSGFLLLYFFVGLPLQILLDISRGKAFTIENIHRLRWMAITLSVFTGLSIMVPLLLWAVNRNVIPDELVPESIWLFLIKKAHFIIGSIGLFLVAGAFKRGYNLQQENALTI